MDGLHQRHTTHRDRALARLRSAPDAGYHRPERLGWRASVAHLAALLDGLPADSLERRRAGGLYLAAFRAFLPLVDPRWWRSHPPVRLNAKVRRELRQLPKLRKRARRGWAREGLGDLELRVCDAFEVYVRAGDGTGVARCLRLFDELSELAAELAAAPAS